MAIAVEAPARNGSEQAADPTKSIFAKEAAEMYARYAVRVEFRGKLVGGIPKDAGLIEGWLRKNMGLTDEQELRRTVVQTLAEEGIIPESAIPEDDVQITDDVYTHIKTLAEKVAGEQHTTGFKQNGHGLYLESRAVKAMLKENTNICFGNERWGPTRKSAKGFLAERVFVYPDEILLGRTEPDGTERFIGHITDQSGRRSTLGYHEYAEKPVLEFEVEVLDDAIKTKDWPRIWISAERNGLGALRSQGFGMFSVTKWDRIS